jgi:hypothetical protein
MVSKPYLCKGKHCIKTGQQHIHTDGKATQLYNIPSATAESLVEQEV